MNRFQQLIQRAIDDGATRGRARVLALQGLMLDRAEALTPEDPPAPHVVKYSGNPEDAARCPNCDAGCAETRRELRLTAQSRRWSGFVERTWGCDSVLTADGLLHISPRCDRLNRAREVRA